MFNKEYLIFNSFLGEGGDKMFDNEWWEDAVIAFFSPFVMLCSGEKMICTEKHVKRILFYSMLLLLLERIFLLADSLPSRHWLGPRWRQTPFSLSSSFFSLSLFLSTFFLLGSSPNLGPARLCEYRTSAWLVERTPRGYDFLRLKCEFCQPRLIHNHHGVSQGLFVSLFASCSVYLTY